MTDTSGDNGMSGRPAVSPLDNGMIVLAGGTVPMAEPLDTVVGLGKWPILKPPTFPAKGWDPTLHAQLLLAEFAEWPWRQQISLARWQPDQNVIEAEIAALVKLQKTKRPERMGEIISQSQDITPYYLDLMMMTPGSHRNNWVLLSAAMAIGHMVGMFFKARDNRPRPVQVYPSLMPPVQTPPHPSYPNNHALQAFLISKFLSLAKPDAVEPLDELAARIKTNREIAGLHFASDGEASRTIGVQIMKQMNTFIAEPKYLFRQVLNDARVEWNS